MSSAAANVGEELAARRAAKVAAVALPQFNPRATKKDSDAAAPPRVHRKVAPCGGTYTKFMNTQIADSGSWDADRKNAFLKTFRDAMASLYRETPRDDGTVVYVSKSDPTIEISRAQYEALLGTEELTTEKIAQQCRARPAPPRPKRKRVKDDTATAVRDVNKIARAGMAKTLADDAAEDLPTKDHVHKLYAPSPWKQILDEERGVYVLQNSSLAAGGSGGVCKPNGKCDADDHLCLKGRCVLAERQVSYRKGGRVITEFAVVKRATPSEMVLITKKHPNGVTIKMADVVDQKQHRSCPPRVREQVTIELSDGTSVTLNNLADKRRRMQIRYLANGDYIPMCVGPSHGRWMLDTGLLDILAERDRKYFPIRQTPVSQEVFDRLVQNNMVLYDVANKKVPFVLVPTDDGEAYERVYPPTIDPAKVAQVYTTENLATAFRKHLNKDLTQDNVDAYIEEILAEMEVNPPDGDADAAM